MNGAFLTWFTPALAYAFVTCATPGPNNAMIASSGATFGLRRSIPHMLGVAIGFPAMLLAVALGAGNALRAYPLVHEILKYLGGAYMLYLAWHIATAKPVVADRQALRAENPGRPLTFVQAGLFQWVNPKAWIIALGSIATYTTADGVVTQSLLLALIFFVVTFPTIGFWALTGVGAARLLRTERAIRVFNWTMAALLIASLIPMLADA